MPLSQTIKDRIVNDYFPRYPNKRAALMPVLWMAQDEQGWLSSETFEEIADLLEMHPTDVAAVASFYVMFHRRPIGKKLIEVCENPSCLINGATETLHAICHKLNLPEPSGHGGSTTPDGEYTVRGTECVAACDKAPAVQVNYRYYGNVTADKVDDFLANMEQYNIEGVPSVADLNSRAQHMKQGR
jgi:NADH-quinone oxidoreductase subunit E